MSPARFLAWDQQAEEATMLPFEEMREPGNLFQAKKDWEDLFANRAWLQLIEALQTQANQLQNEILFGDVVSEGDAYMMERRKGKLEGRLSITATAEAMLAEVEGDYNSAVQQKEQDDVEA